MIEGMVAELIECGLVPDAEQYAADPEGTSMAMYDLGLICPLCGGKPDRGVGRTCNACYWCYDCKASAEGGYGQCLGKDDHEHQAIDCPIRHPRGGQDMGDN